jgi:hypothetical protein
LRCSLRNYMEVRCLGYEPQPWPKRQHHGHDKLCSFCTGISLICSSEVSIGGWIVLSAVDTNLMAPPSNPLTRNGQPQTPTRPFRTGIRKFTISLPSLGPWQLAISVSTRTLLGVPTRMGLSFCPSVRWDSCSAEQFFPFRLCEMKVKRCVLCFHLWSLSRCVMVRADESAWCEWQV